MKSLLLFDHEDRTLWCSSALIDCVENQLVVDVTQADNWVPFQKFIIERAQKALGKLPVHIVPIDGTLAESGRFSGARVFARFSSFRPSDPDTLEIGILFWHQNAIDVRVHAPVISGLNWEAFAEAVDF